MKKIKFAHLFILFVCAFFVYNYVKVSKIQNDIKNHGKNIIVKFVKKKRYPKTTDFYFSYYFKDSLITARDSGIKYSICNSEKETQAINNLEIGEYYLASFNSKYPNIINVNLKKRITDTLEIQKFGFSNNSNSN